MSTFTLPNTTPEVPVHLASGLTKDQLLSFPAFKNWISTLKHSLSLQQCKSHTFYDAPYKLRRIEIQAVDFFGESKLGFVKLIADVSNDNGDKLPGSVFLRGGSVAMLLILQPDDTPTDSEKDKYAVLTIQPRIAAGSLAMYEIPAGMIDDSGSFAGKAAQEIQEETGLEISQEELYNLTEAAIESKDEERLQNAVYPSPGGCDEFIPIFLCRKRMPKKEIEELQGKLTGLREHGEMITLKLVPLEKLWQEGGRDGKALAAWALYEGLRKAERL
ncbi:MAG: hypothetical protein M1834_004313 [Cirrosporium novae-zelandiae]|nr:MAG: hypothetical protein M1834_004313 [Cirrosporium novae-zelandiae]